MWHHNHIEQKSALFSEHLIKNILLLPITLTTTTFLKTYSLQHWKEKERKSKLFLKIYILEIYTLN